MAEAAQKFEATGRRKTSVARVRMHPGSGQITINGRKVDEYLRRDALEMIMMQPLQLVESRDKFDIAISTSGGGKRGQAGAASLGIARALVSFDPTMRTALKRAGFLTRDPREKERKKYGLAGARKRFQFSKR
ncbi:MAG: 30S ribosomal protein S9 [Gemmatimonadetes bacterium]|jgi:small subunit ribosomal protein S9|nr:30S ribosomal protein S9 [Gemmatimonadota bacterium]MBI94722.1 30S ribosomal protein S9 [Gemmatimonadaceae bacterium]MEC8933174.1 30S ribosomal protein S9 [Candidatus Latescibacterota bacterium]MEE3261736.1 30S ribosomal protein S9 [Candidatus Latescibacterota bacterium]|tara:strand:+ start:371 stop:769 length:399 start_codon:yes stop_codon:yes gene_type:complete